MKRNGEEKAVKPSRAKTTKSRTTKATSETSRTGSTVATKSTLSINGGKKVMKKDVIILNGGTPEATRVLVNGKAKSGFTGVTYDAGVFTVNFGDESIVASSLSTISSADWGKGTRLVDVGYGRTRTILSVGADGALLGGPNGRNLKNGNIEVPFADLATSYVPEQYAASLGVCKCCEDEDPA